MKSGFCDRYFQIYDHSDLYEAGFECVSVEFCENQSINADELCFFGTDEDIFSAAVEAAIKNGIKRLVIGEDFALANEAQLLALQRMPFEIAVENNFTDISALSSFLEKAKKSKNSFGLCLNTGHAILHGKEPHEIFELFGNSVFSIHANDNHRTADYHLPPFRGRKGVDWDKFTSAVAETKYDGELYLDIRSIGCPSREITKKSLKVLYLIAEEINKMIEEKIMKEIKKQLLSELQSGRMGKIVDTTFQNLIDRLSPDGFLPESLTGYYKGEFPRSAGAYALLMLENGRDDLARLVLSYVFDTVKEMGLPRIPHVIREGRSFADPIDQIDGAAHNILGYARTCLIAPNKEFEDKYYDYCRKEIISYYDFPYFYFNYAHATSPFASHRLGLIFNMQYEHDREDRLWACFDMVTQSFVGAAGDAMLRLAEKRGDGELAEILRFRTKAHREGVEKYMTFDVDGKKLYMEMRLPDSNFGIPYPALGFTNYGPIAAGWEGINKDILEDTLNHIESIVPYYDAPSDSTILMQEYNPDGSLDMQTYGKAIAWMIEHQRMKGEFAKIYEWFKFFNHYHEGHDILCEMFYMKDGEWVFRDYGNGEQCIWFCMMLLLLRRELEEELS